jgi:hypothetical protein
MAVLCFYAIAEPWHFNGKTMATLIGGARRFILGGNFSFPQQPEVSQVSSQHCRPALLWSAGSLPASKVMRCLPGRADS